MTLVPFKTIEVVKSLENEMNENYKIYLEKLNEKNNSSNYSIGDAFFYVILLFLIMLME